MRERARGDCLKYLKRGWNKKAEKRGGETKILKGGKLGQGVGAIKKGELEPPYELCYPFSTLIY